jgi:hypothetical protein
MSLAEHFLTLAERQTPEPVKRKLRAFAKREAEKLRVPTPAEKKIREQSGLTAAHKRARRLEWKEALLGPYGKRLATLKRSLARCGPADAERMAEHVEEQAAEWLRAADMKTRHEAWRLCSARIQKIRENEGLPPFDDAITSLIDGDPGEPPCVAMRCRNALRDGLPW